MNLRTLVVALSVALGCTLTTVQPAPAQESGEKSGTSTVVLKFDKRKVPQSVMDTFYRSLNKVINQSDEMHTVSGGEITIQEMTVTAGCSKPNAKCLKGLDSYVEAKRMVFGSIKRSGQAYLFTIKMFDFPKGKFIREVSGQTVEGDEAAVKRAIPGVVQGFMYGNVGKLRVTATGGGSATVLFNGEERGQTPATLKNLPLGQQAVSVQHGSGAKETKLVVLRKGKTKQVEFEVGPASTGGARAGGGGSTPILGYSATGLGVAGLAVGIVGHIQNAQAEQRAQALKCPSQQALCGEGSQEELARRAEEQTQRVQNTAILSTVGYSVGAVGLAAGGYLLYRHFFASGSKTALRSIQLRPRAGGAQVGFTLQF